MSLRNLFPILISIFILFGCAHHQNADSEDLVSHQPESTAPASNVEAKKAEVIAGCFKGDAVKVWETRYILSKSGADDVDAKAFKEELARFKNDKNIPKEKCARIIWLKDKTCSDDFGSGHTRKECLSDPNYLKKLKMIPT